MPIDILALRALVANVRPIASALHTTRCAVVTRTWNDGEIGSGIPVDDQFLLGQECRVSKLTQKEILTSGGEFSFNDVKVEHITPTFPGGGYSLDQIAPSSQIPARALTDGLPSDPAVEYFYILSGDINGKYRLITCNDDKALHYTLFLREIDVHATAFAR